MYDPDTVERTADKVEGLIANYRAGEVAYTTFCVLLQAAGVGPTAVRATAALYQAEHNAAFLRRQKVMWGIGR